MKNIDLSIFEKFRDEVITEIKSVISSITEQRMYFHSSSTYDWVDADDESDEKVSIPYKLTSLFIDGDNRLMVEYLVLSFTDEESCYQYTTDISDFSADGLYIIMQCIKREQDRIVLTNGKKKHC
jgi:hypothetical protein